MKKLNFIMILFVILFLTSCKVPTSVKFENYVDNVEANCEYWTEQEWDAALEEYEQLVSEYEANYDNNLPEVKACVDYLRNN